MSIQHFVFLPSDRLPDREEWQAELGKWSNSLELDRSLDVHTHSGFLPVLDGSRETGFEFSIVAAKELGPAFAPNVLRRAHDPVAVFRCHGDIAEAIAAIWGAATFAAVTKGTYFNEEGPEVVGPAEIIHYARKVVEELESV